MLELIIEPSSPQHLDKPQYSSIERHRKSLAFNPKHFGYSWLPSFQPLGRVAAKRVKMLVRQGRWNAIAN
jgi:hypothetical protein